MSSLIIGSGIAAFVMYAAHKTEWHDKNTKIILDVFKNTNYKVGDRVPRLFKKSQQEKYTDYIFNVPFGLVDKKELEPILEKTLGRHVTVKFKRKLFVRVYNEELEIKYNYDWKPTEKWTVPIGYSLDGMIYHNFEHIPHMTVAGTTRYGKTVLLKLIFTHLIKNNPEVEFYILDLKGGLEFGRYKSLKNVKQVARNISSANSCLRSIVKKLDDDMSCFESKSFNNIVNTNISRRRFIIVDEGAELDKDCYIYLSKITRVGGALGYRLVFATQYPTADTLPRQVKQNADAKVSFRLPTEIASRVALDEKGAEQIEHVGRAIYRTSERKLVQVLYIDDKDIENDLRRFKRDDPAKEKRTTRGEDTITFG